MQAMFTGSGPRMLMVSPRRSRRRRSPRGWPRPARPRRPARAERRVSFDDLPPLGPPGREVSRQRIEDMDVTIVRFANGSTLTFKHTEFERGSVQVRLRFGAGMAVFRPTARRSAGSAGWSALGPGRLDLDGMERLLTGRRIGLSFGIDEDALVLRGVDPRGGAGRS